MKNTFVLNGLGDSHELEVDANSHEMAHRLLSPDEWVSKNLQQFATFLNVIKILTNIYIHIVKKKLIHVRA